MSAPSLKSLASPAARRIFKALSGKAMFVGGAVRDLLSGSFSSATDIDIATPFTPDEIIKRLEAAGIKAIPTGYKHGTITALIKGKTFEITSLRQDIKTDGRKAVVSYGTDYVQDARRRDFTINALYADLNGTLFDPLGTGRRDLSRHRLRFIGDPETRIKEDHLRILRFFRFLICLGWSTPDKAALAAIKKSALLIPKLSKERIKSELFKILSAPAPFAALKLMHKTKVLQNIDLSLTNLPRYRKATAFAALLSVPVSPVFALFSLSRNADPVAFKKRLVLSNAEYDELCFLSSCHRKAFAAIRKKGVKVAAFTYGVPLCLAAFCLGGGLARDFKPSKENTKVINELKRFTPPSFPLTGKDLLALGIKPDKNMGVLLSKLKEKWLKSDFSLSKRELLVSLKKTSYPNKGR